MAKKGLDAYERSNNYFLDAAPSYLVAYATLVKISRAGDYFCGGSTSSHSEQRSKTRESRWYCKTMWESRKSPVFYRNTIIPWMGNHILKGCNVNELSGRISE